jgi:hypothetical protein
MLNGTNLSQINIFWIKLKSGFVFCTLNPLGPLNSSGKYFSGSDAPNLIYRYIGN